MDKYEETAEDFEKTANENTKISPEMRKSLRAFAAVCREADEIMKEAKIIA